MSEGTFGSLLRRYRSQRGLSQEKLALEAEISTRHLSCLETNKAAPSRTMVLLLGSALDITLRDRNALLEAAGFVAAYRAEQLRRAIDIMLRAMEPTGAVAVDRAWNVLQMNGAAARLLSAFMDIAAAPPEIMTNVVLSTLHPAGLRPAIVNFEEVAAFTIERSRREIQRMPDDPRTREMRAQLDAIPDVPKGRTPPTPPGGPFLTVHLRRNGLEARIFTTISTIGTPIDATAEEIAIETFFPADDATAALMKSLAAA